MLTAFERRSGSKARPGPSNVGPVARVEAIREKVVGSARATGSLYVAGLRTMDDCVTLMLHGDVDAGTVPHLEAVLEGLIRLQPVRLVVDLSEVGSVSLDALRMIDRYGTEVGDLALRSVNSATRANLERLGRVNLIETTAFGPASA